MKIIIKEKVQVSKIMPKIKKYVTESLKAEVLVRSTNQPQTSYAVAASLLEFEFKKILIDKMEENKSINKSNIQKNLYNALVESYNSEKDIITSYGDVVTLKRVRDDQDKDEDPSTGSNRGSKRRRSSKEAESSKEPTHKESKSTSSSQSASRSQPKSSGKMMKVIGIHQALQPLIVNDIKQRLLTTDHLNHGSHKWLKTQALPLIQIERGRQFIPWDYFINNDLEYLKGESLCQKHTTFVTKTKAADYGQVKWMEDKVSRIQSSKKVIYDKHAYWGTYHWDPKRQKFYEYASNMETSKDVYSRHMIIGVTSLKIMKYFGYSHLEEIIIRRQDDKLYKFREGDFKRLRRQDTEDMLLLLVQDKLSNLNLEEQYALNESKATRRRSNSQGLTAYLDIQGIIYEDEMNINRLMRTNELHKFSGNTLNHVSTALNDIATGIEMDYLPKRKWSKQDKQRARVMINAIDRKLRDRRLMRNLEKFIGERPYGGDLLRLLERTI
nr:hypothetical protein [Tanacetum cinerariifolium]